MVALAALVANEALAAVEAFVANEAEAAVAVLDANESERLADLVAKSAVMISNGNNCQSLQELCNLFAGFAKKLAI